MENALSLQPGYSAAISSASPVSLEDLRVRFLSWIDASPKTIQTYTRAIRQFFKWLRAEEISRPVRADILRWRDQLKASHAAATIQAYIIAVRQFFKWTAAEGLYPNVAEHIKGAKIRREHKKDALTASQVKAVLSKIDRSGEIGLRDYALFALLSACGLRDIEASRANIQDLRQIGGEAVLFVQGKGRSDKTEYVKLAPAVEAAIREYLGTRPEASPNAPLFVSGSNRANGERLSTRSISGAIKSALLRAGYNSARLTAHSLRHTAITLALLGGCSLQEVQQFARHSSINTTQIYAHNLERAANRSEAAIAAALF